MYHNNMIRLLRCALNMMDSPESRGTFGEMIVASIFDPRFFGEEEHYIVNDIIFETPDGKTHQIDHIVIYKTGIFCIETKNIEGLILGHPNIKSWRVYNGNQPYEIFNPILQNKKHIAVLSEFIEWKYDIHSIVVFIKGNKPKDCGDEVLNLQELKDYVKNYSCNKELTSEEMKALYNSLTIYKDESDITTAEHIKNVNEKKQ